MAVGECEIELIKLASAAQELIHTHKPLKGQERDMRCRTLLMDLSPTISTYSRSVHISRVHTVQSEGFGEWELTNKAMNSTIWEVKKGTLSSH